MSTVLGIIPLRMASSRLPGKPLLHLGEKPIFVWVVEKALQCPDLDKIIIATESEEIIKEAEKYGFTSVLTPIMNTGSDRVAYVAGKESEYDIVVNIQGDEPFLNFDDISSVISSLKEEENADISTLFRYFDVDEDPNIISSVKVVTDDKNFALYFSRLPIPYSRNKIEVKYKKHIGIYAYRKEFLLKFSEKKFSILEKNENLEQLRALEMGAKIKVIRTNNKSFGIDTPEDYERAKKIIKSGYKNG